MNSNIIEFIGPPGIGKSTIYKSLCKKWNAQANWTHEDRLLLTKKPPVSNTKVWLEYQVKKIIKKNGSNNIQVDYGLRFAERNKALAQFLWDHLSCSNTYGTEEIGKKLRSAYFLFRDFCRYQAIWDINSDKPCLIEEGLLVKSFLILPDEHAMTNLIEEYVPLLVLPRAVFYINTMNIDLIVDRLLTRKKIIASHKGKDRNSLLADIQKWQFLYKLIIKKLEQFKVPVYCIDGLRPVEENVILINDLLSKQL